MTCKICSSPSEKIFEKIILQKYNSGYYKCTSCSFVQTDEPIWLKEAYESAITSLDLGLLARNNYLVTEISQIINCCFADLNTMLDYAGGYGVFVRLMRDLGYEFYRQDDYCDNLFAKHFDIEDVKIRKFDLATAFEVLEHFNDPLNEIKKVFDYSDNVIFSTELVPDTNLEIENWVYIAQETGQHIAFYSTKTMLLIAEKFDKDYYCRNGNIHVFTSRKFTPLQIDFAFNGVTKLKRFFGLVKNRLRYKNHRESFSYKDYLHLKSILNG